jgi:hypothetical protein
MNKPTIEKKTTSYKNLDVVRGRSTSGSDKGIPTLEKLKVKERPLSVIQTGTANASDSSGGAKAGGKQGFIGDEFHSHLVYLIKDFQDTIVAKKGGTIAITPTAVSFSLTVCSNFIQLIESHCFVLFYCMLKCFFFIALHCIIVADILGWSHARHPALHAAQHQHSLVAPR